MHLHPFWPLCKWRSGSNPKNQAVKKRLKTFREWVGLHCGVERAAALFVSSSSVCSDQMTWALKWPVTFLLLHPGVTEWKPWHWSLFLSFTIPKPNIGLDPCFINLVTWTNNQFSTPAPSYIGLKPVCLSGHPPGREETVSVFPSGCHFFRLLQLDIECRHHEIQPG